MEPEPVAELTLDQLYLLEISEFMQLLINRIEFVILILIFITFIYTYKTLRGAKR
jgi:hypothetical protein